MGMRRGLSMTVKKKEREIRPESILYDIIQHHPALRRKISKLFGKKCLSCPSSKKEKETIAYTAFIKGYDPDVVIRELNQILLEKAKGR